MKQFSPWQALYLSFFSKRFYQDVAQRWHGTAFGYLLLLVAIWWIPGAVMLYLQGVEFATTYAPKVIEQVPTITVTRGRVSLDASMPYVITDPDTGKRLAVIDTTGQITTLEAAQSKALLTGTDLILQEGQTEARVYRLANIEHLVVDRARLYDWLEVFRTWFVPVASVFAILFIYGYRVVQVLIYAAIGMLFARRLRLTLGYAALLRLSVVAITPAALLDVLFSAAGVSVPGAVSLGLAMAYLYYGIRANTTTDSVVAA